jgi:2-polyprenyl-3-methyl-5-hydroxy-6-metoxy-1,4-benzoquinol methylase
MTKYHKYVFDINQGKYVGDFEKNYHQESVEILNSWHLEDQRQLKRKIDLKLLNSYNFNCIIDLGCGKGSFFHLLKRKNNNVYSSDISETAIKFASERLI